MTVNVGSVPERGQRSPQRRECVQRSEVKSVASEAPAGSRCGRGQSEAHCGRTKGSIKGTELVRDTRMRICILERSLVEVRGQLGAQDRLQSHQLGCCCSNQVT